MSKTIVQIDQISDGGKNPETDITEDVLWTLHFDSDEGTRTLGRNQMLEYLTTGTSPIKNVHSFKKWEIKTKLGHVIRTWVIVYDDHTHVQLVNKDFYSLIANGHRNKDEEREEREEREKAREEIMNAPPSEPQSPIFTGEPIITSPDERKEITSLDEREEIDSFRDKAKEEGRFQDFRDLIKKDALPHPDKTGYEDKK